MYCKRVAKFHDFRYSVMQVAYFQAIHLLIYDDMLISVDLMLQTHPNACAPYCIEAPALLSFVIWLLGLLRAYYLFTNSVIVIGVSRLQIVEARFQRADSYL